ncbi:hypothetical protein NQ317_013598 [Molorchus minor]|uniref:Protein C10 n=1 Tax=Molorchus minor TaxID=1323400 RepID=A0ABQ9ISI5_9CUCU|nr:hypothetical protein NQ317_013598 [Molorchus minor]
MPISETTSLSSELAMDILKKTLEELKTPEIIKKLEEVKNNVGNEMLKMMQYVFPIVMQVEMDVIKHFGYPEGKDGMIKFSQSLRNLEREDTEICRLHSLIKAYYWSPVSVHTSNESSEEKTAVVSEIWKLTKNHLPSNS